MASIKGSSIFIEPFEGRGDFTLWQQRMKSLLTQEVTIKALKVKTRRTKKMTDDEWVTSKEKDKPKKMPTDEWEDLKDMETSTILLCLANNTLRKVLGLTNSVDIWNKLESCYKSKSLTNKFQSTSRRIQQDNDRVDLSRGKD